MHGEKIFELGMYHPAFITFLILLGVASFAILGFQTFASLAIFLMLAFAIWVASLVSLCRHRRLTLHSAKECRSDALEDPSTRQSDILHHNQLDKVRLRSFPINPQMILLIIIMASFSLIQPICLFWAFFESSYANILFNLGSVMPDLLFIIMLMPTGPVDQFVASQYTPKEEVNYHYDPYTAQEAVE